jgi:glutamyl-tRNA(Gln) amidotransferase subunit D
LYPKSVENFLKKRGIEIGDEIEIIKAGVKYQGILMPRIELGDPSNLVIKLSNGYNIGIKFDKNVKVKLLRKGEPIKFVPLEAKVEIDPTKPTVSILGCGGTIAARVEYKTGAVFAAFSPNDLLFSFPKLKEIANVEGRKLFDLMSEDMTPFHWSIIAKEVAEEIKNGVDGVVLMHGTDTMHYTSAALSFALQNLPVPVVLVGAQRSSDRGSSDNYVNLISSVLTATKSNIAEVTICMHGSTSDDFCFVHQGTRVRKMHTSRRDTFKSINALPYAKVWHENRKIEYLRNDFKKVDKSRKLKLANKFHPDVGLIYIHPAIKPEFIASLSKFYDGIVLAVTGLGHVPTNLSKDRFTKSIIPSIKSLIDSGIPVVVAPQTLYGRLNLSVYAPQRILKSVGVIGDHMDWLPETAFVKLSWVLAQTRNMKRVRELMLTNVAGEISECSIVEFE